jgi:hypothetical protein
MNFKEKRKWGHLVTWHLHQQWTCCPNLLFLVPCCDLWFFVLCGLWNLDCIWELIAGVSESLCWVKLFMVMYAKSPYDFHHYFCLTSQFLTLCILNFFNFQLELHSGNLLHFAISDRGLEFCILRTLTCPALWNDLILKKTKWFSYDQFLCACASLFLYFIF